MNFLEKIGRTLLGTVAIPIMAVADIGIAIVNTFTDACVCYLDFLVDIWGDK